MNYLALSWYTIPRTGSEAVKLGLAFTMFSLIAGAPTAGVIGAVPTAGVNGAVPTAGVIGAVPNAGVIGAVTSAVTRSSPVCILSCRLTTLAEFSFCILLLGYMNIRRF